MRPGARSESTVDLFLFRCFQIPIEKKEQDNQEKANGTGEVSLIHEDHLSPYSPIFAPIAVA
jgi:hypothetical protein